MRILSGRTIIVTGTARGIGKTMVETFASNGANVVACARTETEGHKIFCEKLANENKVQIIPMFFEMTDAA